MATFALEDLEGSVEVIVFPELYRSAQEGLEDDRAVAVRGKAEHEDGRWRLVAEDVSPLAGAAERRAASVILEVNAQELAREGISEVQRLLNEHPGECPVLFRLVQPGGYRLTVRPQSSTRVGPTPALTEALERVLGKGSVSYR